MLPSKTTTDFTPRVPILFTAGALTQPLHGGLPHRLALQFAFNSARQHMSIWDKFFSPKYSPAQARTQRATRQQLQSTGGGAGTGPATDKISALIGELHNNPDSKARLKAAIELSRNPSEASTSALIKGLKDSATDVRACCAESLRMLKDLRAVEPLIEVLLTDA